MSDASEGVEQNQFVQSFFDLTAFQKIRVK